MKRTIELFLATLLVTSLPCSEGVIHNPSQIGKLLRNEVVGNKLFLEWEPPSVPNGPISFYRVEAADLFKDYTYIAQTDNPRFTNTFDGYAYSIRIRASNFDDSTNTTYDGDWYRFIREFRKPEAPKALNLTVGRREVYITVIPSISSTRFQYRVDVSSDGPRALSVFEYSGSYQKAIFDIDPYTRLQLNATAYLHSEDENYSIYGGTLNAGNITTNVEAPSKVQDLQMTSSSADDIILKWWKPREPQGPIDGYKIFIRDVDGKLLNQASVNHDSEVVTQSFTYNKQDGQKAYNFTVAAFNKDLITEEELIGKGATVTPTKAFGAWAIIGVAVAVALLALIVGVLLYKRRAFRKGGTSFITTFSRSTPAEP